MFTSCARSSAESGQWGWRALGILLHTLPGWKCQTLYRRKRPRPCSCLLDTQVASHSPDNPRAALQFVILADARAR